MSVNHVPTIIIGIGGVGCKIAAGISDLLSDSDRRYVGVIGVDTNVNDLALLKGKHKMETIQTSDDIDVMQYLNGHKEYLEWFPENDFLRKRTMTNGAGQVRTLSRLAMISAVENGRFIPIKTEIDRIRRIDDNPHNSSLTVMIVGSITGGTGAGLFLQMPLFIRDLVKTQVGLRQLVIRGMFIGPDVMEDVQPSKINRDAVCVNGYTCLKELNAFNMRPAYSSEMTDNLRLEFYDNEDLNVSNVPYNYLYLVERSGKLGSIGDTKLGEIFDYVSHIVYTLLFSPVTADALSIEDNFILASIGQGGMNKFAGAGMCRLVYPKETAQKYVALRVVKELVQKEWLLIDRSFEALKKAAMAKQRTDSTTELPEIKKSYLELFKTEALGDHAKLGMFAKEAFVERSNEYISVAYEYMKNLDELIQDLMDSEEVMIAENNCEINDQKMKTFSDAQGQINNVWDSMRAYAKLAKHLVDTKPMNFADQIFPQSAEVMEFNKDKKRCVYGLLSKVHPVTARFIIYDIINILEKEMESLKNEIAGVDLSAYTKEDFDAKAKGDQSPSDALRTLRDKRNPIWKMLGSIGNAINSEERAIKKLKIKLEEVSRTHIGTTHCYIENAIKYNVCEILLERFNELAENYLAFFNTVSSKIDRNDEDIIRLENIRFPYGQNGVYCSKEAFDKMTDEYFTGSTIMLSDETKKAIFDQIFSIQARAFAISGKKETPAEKEKRIRKAQLDLERVFSSAVVDTILNDVIEKGGKTVNLTAREALFKECELVEGVIPSDKDYAERVGNYIKNRIETAMRVAEPMIATDIIKDKTEISFLAVSDACSETDANLNPDVSQTAYFYLPNSYGSSTVMINDEFPDTEIVCLRLQYNYKIENLIKYKYGSRNEKAYRDRILNLGMKPKQTGNPDDAIVTVNPHLNCHWHEEGFIPAITEKQREIDKQNDLKAFIYALALDIIQLINDDENPDENGNPRPTWFAYTNGYAMIQPIKKCGKLIGNGYSDVFDAISYNGMLKMSILRDAQKHLQNIKGYKTSEELFDGLLDLSLVDDLIHTGSGDNASDANLFDIFQSMRSHTKHEKWEKLFDGLLITLWEICEILFDNNSVTINKATRRILEAIYGNSFLARKPESEQGKEEKLFVSYYNAILRKKYGEEEE